MQALSYFASGEECKGKISEVLQHIEENHLMPPLMVVQTLAESQYATLSDIKVGEIRLLFNIAYLQSVDCSLCTLADAIIKNKYCAIVKRSNVVAVV